jgi:glycosyltransferase involved in cell wall biosynthesis
VTDAEASRRALHLVFVTQIVDPDDPVLGVICDSMIALGRECELTVIANTVRSVPAELTELGVHVESLGKERGTNRVWRGLAYQRALWRAFHERNASALLAHMCPTYLVQAAPIARLHHARTMMWFAHWRDSRLLRAAERRSDVILTSLPGAYPRITTKVRVIGQAIAVDRYARVPDAVDTGELRLVAIGRTSPAKRFDLAVEAVARLRAAGTPVRLRIVGPSTTSEELAHRDELAKLVADRGLEHAVDITGPVPPSALQSVFADCDVLVNATATGTGDKAAFEAMAARRPVIASNPAFAELLAAIDPPLQFEPGDVDGLVAVLQALRDAGRPARAAIGEELRRRVRRDHSADRWARKVLEVARG